MTDKKKIAELDKAIKDTCAELAAVQQEKKTAANDAERLVLAEKKERRIAGTLAALEQAKTAAAYTPPEPTDRAELLAGFQKYRDAKAEKVAKVAALPVYPDGAIMAEWEAICERTLPDWRRRVLQVETLAAEYKAACRELLEMHNTLKAVRGDIERLASADGHYPPAFSPVFTAGLDTKRLTVQKGDYIQLTGIASPLSGRAL